MKTAAIALLVLVACKPQIVVVKPPRPNMPAPPSDFSMNLPADTDMAALWEAVLKDLADYRAYSAQLKKIVESTTEEPKKK